MKRFLMLCGILLAPLGLSHGFAMPWQAGDALWASYKSATIATSTVAVVVNVAQGQGVKIGGWSVEVDKVAAGTTTVKLGVVTAINSSSGTVRWFWVKTLGANVSNTTNLDTRILWPSSVDTWVVGGGPGSLGGTTPGFSTSDRVTYADAEALEYQDDVLLPTVEGAQTFPNVGDILMRVIGGGSTNTTNATVHMLYFVR